jgi:RNAse (barnase) inhibitor barstar
MELKLDGDLKLLSVEELREEVQKLRDAIRAQRDQNGHNLCWYLPELWDVLPEKVQPQPFVPTWKDFMQRCADFRSSLDSKAE